VIYFYQDQTMIESIGNA